MPKSRFFYWVNMSFKAVRENKILAKISEFTVSCYCMFYICKNKIQIL